MDTRVDSFVRKFSSAQSYLDTKSIQNIISLKFRSNVNYSTYVELIDGILNKRTDLKTEEIRGDFQGKAWLVTDKNDNKVILVEHETGLEILYIAGSIASLISLIQMIGSAWQRIRTGFRRPYDPEIDNRFEKRMLDSKNQIVEDHGTIFENYLLRETLSEFLVLEKRVKKLEQKLAKCEKNKVELKKSTKVSKKGKK